MKVSKGLTFSRVIRFVRINLEGIIWLAALVSFIFHDPVSMHYTLCPFDNLGFSFCPGCGLGHSISYLFHGEFILSLEAHPLGIFAVVLLTYRIISIFRRNYSENKILLNF